MLGCSKPTEVEWRFTEEGEEVRVSARTGRIVPLPPDKWDDLVTPQQYIRTYALCLNAIVTSRRCFVHVFILNHITMSCACTETV